MKPRKRSTTSTKKRRVKVPETVKIALITKVIDLLIKVLNKTKDKYAKCKKPFNCLSRLKKDELDDILKIDAMLRDCDWLGEADRKWLEIDVGENDDGTPGPSCSIVNDVVLYMERVPGILTDTNA